MSKTTFTSEQIAELSANPYTYNVTPKFLLFTKEFKELFWGEYCSGKPPRMILRECGYDTELLGTDRISGIQQSLKREYHKWNTFHDGKCPPKAAAPTKSSSDETVTIKQLQHEVEYLKQEIEFLKKTYSIRSTRK